MYEGEYVDVVFNRPMDIELIPVDDSYCGLSTIYGNLTITDGKITINSGTFIISN